MRRKPRRIRREKFGVPNLDDVGLSGYRPAGLRAYRLENKQTAGKSIAQLRPTYPQYRILNIVRGGEALGASPDLAMQMGDVVALGGRMEDLTANMGLLHEVADSEAGHPSRPGGDPGHPKEGRRERTQGVPAGGFCRPTTGGSHGTRWCAFPVGAETKLQRFDVLFVAGLRSAVDKVAAAVGRVARPARGPTS